jgi:hypothetical protein
MNNSYYVILENSQEHKCGLAGIIWFVFLLSAKNKKNALNRVKEFFDKNFNLDDDFWQEKSINIIINKSTLELSDNTFLELDREEVPG